MKATLLFGSETWVVTPRMVQTLVGLHHRADRRLTGKLPQRQRTGVFIPPPSGRCSEVGGYEVDYDVYRAEKEYGCAVHCYMADSGSLIGCGGTARARVVKRWW